MNSDENNNSLRGVYPNIPDHSDLRGFSYKAPENYEWEDDHGASSTHYGSQNGRFYPGSPASSRASLWDSLRHFLAKGPKGYCRSDERIREDVCEALMRHPGIDASQIEVRVKDGAVVLAGTVPDRWMKRASEWAVDRVRGVVGVTNELSPSPSDD